MGQVIRELLRDWSQGIVTAAEPDALPVGASPRGWNTAFVSTAAGSAIIGSRKGGAVHNTTAITGSPTILGHVQYLREASGVFTSYHVAVSNNGRVDLVASDGSLSNISTALTSGNYRPSFAQAKNLLFLANSQEAKKYNGTALQNFGITRPGAPTAAPKAGGAMTAATYDVGLTYYNSATGHESSLSDFTTVTLSGGNLQMDVSWSAPADTQVDYVRVYIRQQSTQKLAFRLVVGSTPAAHATHGGFPVATTAIVVNVSDAQLRAFISKAPSTFVNDPPPAGIQWLCWYRGRMFAATGSYLYYSQLNLPESFDGANEPVNPQDGDIITGLHPTSAGLLVFKRDSTYILQGDDPASWVLEVLDPELGCVSNDSAVTVEGVTRWWSELGPVMLSGGGLVAIGTPFIAPQIAPDALAYNYLNGVVAGVDILNQMVIWSVPEAGQTRNSLLLPYNYRLNRWAASVWNPFDVASIAVIEDSESRPWLYFGNYGGQLFKWWSGDNDGVPSGTLNGTVTSATSTTLTDSTAAFYTTGAGLKERYVYAINSTNTDIQRRRITSNTATQLTIASAWTTNPDTTYTYVVGGIQFEFDTPWMDGGSPFVKKRFEYLFAQLGSDDAGVVVTLELYTNYDTTVVRADTDVAVSSQIGIYDTSLYDAAIYAITVNRNVRTRVGRSGTSWRARLRKILPNTNIKLYKIEMQSETKGRKLG